MFIYFFLYPFFLYPLNVDEPWQGHAAMELILASTTKIPITGCLCLVYERNKMNYTCALPCSFYLAWYQNLPFLQKNVKAVRNLNIELWHFERDRHESRECNQIHCPLLYMTRASHNCHDQVHHYKLELKGGMCCTGFTFTADSLLQLKYECTTSFSLCIPDIQYLITVPVNIFRLEIYNQLIHGFQKPWRF